MPRDATQTSSLWRELFRPAVYKRAQGRICRQATAGVLMIVVALGAYSLHFFLTRRMVAIIEGVIWLVTLGNVRTNVSAETALAVNYAVCSLLFALGVWIAYRLVNLPRFADFLIAVEAEMSKVSWPTRLELTRASIVVLITMFGIAAVIYLFDLVWQWLLSSLGVLGPGG
ncbi:MAG: preprotein translocase subunit SecE [Pirellulales bacterium]|nr:preprotein translocase subunit SecE [Pirellulales bacterium]